MFTEPTTKALVDPKLLDQQKNESESLNDWVETFLLAEGANFSEEVKQVMFEEKKWL